jgi:hypothetical protein
MLHFQRFGGVARIWGYWAHMPSLGTIIQQSLVKQVLLSSKANRTNYFEMEATHQKLLQHNYIYKDITDLEWVEA